jgi:hypothetical protein
MEGAQRARFASLNGQLTPDPRLLRIACRPSQRTAEVLYTDPEVAVMRVEHIRPYNIDLMSAEKVGNP